MTTAMALGLTDGATDETKGRYASSSATSDACIEAGSSHASIGPLNGGQGDRARRTQAPAVARRDEQRRSHGVALPHWTVTTKLTHTSASPCDPAFEMAGAVPGERTSRLQHSAEVTVSLDAEPEVEAPPSKEMLLRRLGAVDVVPGTHAAMTCGSSAAQYERRRGIILRRVDTVRSRGAPCTRTSRLPRPVEPPQREYALRVSRSQEPVLTITARTSRVTHGSRSESCKRAGRARDAPAGSGQVNGRPVSPLESVRVGSPGHAR